MSLHRVTYPIISGLLLFLISSGAHGAEQKQIDLVINVIERFCLSGKQYQFSADAGGNISIKNLSPGGKGNINVNIKSASGGVAYLNEKIRNEFDQNTRNCMQPYIDRVINLILGKDNNQSRRNIYFQAASMLRVPQDRIASDETLAFSTIDNYVVADKKYTEHITYNGSSLSIPLDVTYYLHGPQSFTDFGSSVLA